VDYLSGIRELTIPMAIMSANVNTELEKRLRHKEISFGELSSPRALTEVSLKKEEKTRKKSKNVILVAEYIFRFKTAFSGSKIALFILKFRIKIVIFSLNFFLLDRFILNENQDSPTKQVGEAILPGFAHEPLPWRPRPATWTERVTAFVGTACPPHDSLPPLKLPFSAPIPSFSIASRIPRTKKCKPSSLSSSCFPSFPPKSWSGRKS
jgi:hypothetical protein